MSDLPITHMTLYKHGVGFFQRRGAVSGREVRLSFRVEEMNDILKSLTVIDRGQGQVLGIDYATPQSTEEQLAGCSVQLRDSHSLHDLLTSARGRAVTLLIDDQQDQEAGILLGIDKAKAEQPLDTSLVSLLREASGEILTFQLSRLRGLVLRDRQSEEDLRFFLNTSLNQEDYRQITIRLTPDNHDLMVSYIAPAPTWRVSYRLVAEAKGEDRRKGVALVLGWGIFDNQLEEELRDISLSLVAGMPISFTYDLYTPFTPERPHVAEEERVAAAPIHFDGAAESYMEEEFAAEPMMAMSLSTARAAPQPKMAKKRERSTLSAKDMRGSVQSNASGESLGELFQYNIATPVTVGRGQSAMVPIVTADLSYEKAYIYNGKKLPNHPVATLRLENHTGLTLERGPVTVIENGEYVGEAVLPFTVQDSEMIVPYAVELGATMREESGSHHEQHRIVLEGEYVKTEDWQITWHDYTVHNRTTRPLQILVEHPRFPTYFQFHESAEPVETADEYQRFLLDAPAGKENKIRVQARHLRSSQETLTRLSHRDIQQYLKRDLLNKETRVRLQKLLDLMVPVERYESHIKGVQQERQAIFKSQKQIQGNMGVLNNKHESEGQLRKRYVTQLTELEDRLRELDKEEKRHKEQITAQKKKINTLIQSWKNEDAQATA